MDLQITIREKIISAALEDQIRQKANKLNQRYSFIINCHVVVDVAQKNQRQGKLYNVRVEIQVPRKTLVATRNLHEDAYIAVRDAFTALERELDEYSERRHGRVKTHQAVMHGQIIRILSDEGYGFIQGDDGNEYYFSGSNVSYPRFNQLHIGDLVEYQPATAAEGWHAYHVIKEKNEPLSY